VLKKHSTFKIELRTSNECVSQYRAEIIFVSPTPTGFGRRQSSAALNVVDDAKAPEGWRSPRRWRA
jgi:hypothetical protein